MYVYSRALHSYCQLHNTLKFLACGLRALHRRVATLTTAGQLNNTYKTHTCTRITKTLILSNFLAYGLVLLHIIMY